MSASVEQRSEGLLPAPFPPSDDALSELGDGSSSLSDIEDKEPDPEDLEGADSTNGIESDLNDSEAETERLENSPHHQHTHKDVVLGAYAESRTYEPSPSKLQHQFRAETEEDDDRDVDDLSDDDVSIDKSTKSLDEVEQDPQTATTSLEDSSGEGKGTSSTQDTASKKRKRSLLPDPESVGENDLEEPASKRTGSVGAPADDYAIDDSGSLNGEPETSNPISGNISDAESLEAEDEEDEEHQQQSNEEVSIEDGTAESADHGELSKSEVDRKKGKKKRRLTADAPEHTDVETGEDVLEEPVLIRPSDEVGDMEEPEDTVEIEGDEAEIALKNEEEQEKKRVAMDQLGDIERHFASFRDRLYDERLAQLEADEASLRQEKPTHREYLAMLQCIDARRDEKLRIEARLTELRLETLQRSSVGKRSQILAQFYQEVREIRENKLELLGKQWYEIQHDRRGYGSNVEDYALRFPARKSQQLAQQLAYNTEVSLLSGIAKYVGFPAAPPMAPATAAELEQDFEKISKLQAKQQSQRAQQGMLLPDLAALRAAASTTGFKPAEEQFIEQTPWANPQHPSHAHVLQHQSLGQQPRRMSSPFSVTPVVHARRQSHQYSLGTPISGTFSGATPSLQPHTNGTYLPGRKSSPMAPHANTVNQPKVAPSPLGSRHTSLSPQQVKPPVPQLSRQESQDESSASVSGIHLPPSSPKLLVASLGLSNVVNVSIDRDQSLVVNGQH